MVAHESRAPGLGKESDQSPHKRRLRLVGQRLAHWLLGAESHDRAPEARRFAVWVRDERGAVGQEVLPRFPLARRGYDCSAVDRYVDGLERDLGELDRELAQLRAQAASPDEVASELQRIGEQTSSVLIAAHEQQEEIVRVAREQAEHLLAEASARANAVTAEAEARVRELEEKSEATHRQRDRLLEDARTVSAGLAALVDGAYERIPSPARA